MLPEREYDALVAASFKRFLRAFDALDPDALEADGTADMVTVTAPRTGEKVIINTQRAVHQIWVAGRGSGIHFSWDTSTSRWLDDKHKGLELFAFVADCVEAAAGVRPTFQD